MGDFQMSGKKEQETKIPVNCRNCINFMRVKENNGWKQQLRGFCQLGQMEGDYSLCLYMSQSQANECPAYIFNSDRNSVKELEDGLFTKRFKFEGQVLDARTNIGKKYSELRKEIKKKYGDMYLFFGKADMYKVFREVEKDTFRQINDYYHFTQKEYNNFLSALRVNFSKLTGVFK